MSSLESILNSTVTLEITNIVEEIQSCIFPTNERLGEKLVDELIRVEKSTGKDKRVSRLKRKIKEMIFLDEFITNKNILLKDYSVIFQEKNSQLKKERKSPPRKDQ